MKNYIFIVLYFVYYSSTAQERILLYPDTIPNAKISANIEEDRFDALVDTLTYNVSIPTLTAFLPPKEKANGTAVIIFPGGGYHVLLSKREGSDVARAFNSFGVAAFVVKYRLPNDQIMVDKTIGPLQDAQQAIKTVRERASEWGINPEKIGVIGFSAGGHVASTAGTHFESVKIENAAKTSLRPDFMLLINPVISFSDSIGHRGSRNNLLGNDPSKEKILYFSNETHVNKDTPPVFLVHSGIDEVVSVQNSLAFYHVLSENKVNAEIHIYGKGEHGFLTWPHFNEWFGRCINWMEGLSLIN